MVLHGGADPHVWNSVIGVWSLSQQFLRGTFLFTHYSCILVVHSTTCDPLSPTVQIGITQSLREPLFDVSTRQAQVRPKVGPT